MIEGCGTLVFKLNANKNTSTTSVIIKKTFSKEMKNIIKEMKEKRFPSVIENFYNR